MVGLQLRLCRMEVVNHFDTLYAAFLEIPDDFVLQSRFMIAAMAQGSPRILLQPWAKKWILKHSRDIKNTLRRGHRLGLYDPPLAVILSESISMRR